MTKDEVRRRLVTEPYFIPLKQFNFDIREMEKHYAEEGSCTDKKIAQALHVKEEDVEPWYLRIVGDLQVELDVK